MNRLIVIGASAGGLRALIELLRSLPPDFSAAILLVMHIGSRRSELPELLQLHTAMPVAFAVDQQELKAGTVSVAPPDYHLLVVRKGERLHAVLSQAAKENHTRPAIDPLFRTAAEAADGRTVGVLLTGYLDDGAAGLQAIQACGGVVVVQDPADAEVPDMPANVMKRMRVDLCASLQNIAAALAQYAVTTPQKVGTHPIPLWLKLENAVAVGEVGGQSFRKIAAPSTYSCADCGGVLFEIGHPKHARYRCHTGDGDTLLSLLAAQQDITEEALQTLIRSLHEQESLAEQLAVEFTRSGIVTTSVYSDMAKRTRDFAGPVPAIY